MATLYNLFKRVKKLVEQGEIYFGQSEESLLEVYRRITPHWVTVMPDGDKYPWGQNSNEDFPSFRKEAAEFLYGVHCPDWIDTDINTTIEMVDYQLYNEDELEEAKKVSKEVLDAFYEVRGNRCTGSEYYFNDFCFFAEAVKAVPSLVEKNDARWWSQAKEVFAIVGDYRLIKRAIKTQIEWDEEKGVLLSSTDLQSCIAGQHVVEDAPEYESAGNNFSFLRARRRIKDAPGWFYEDIQLVPDWAKFTNVERVQENPGGTHWKKILLSMGYSPKELSAKLGFPLSKREAHEWVVSEVEDPRDWYMPGWAPRTADRAVVDWAEKKYECDAMHKERTVYGPAGENRTFTFWEILDEVRGEDLVNGLRTSVERAFESAAQRRENQLRRDMGEQHVPLPLCPLGDGEEIKQVKTSSDLEKEGKEMGHCVGGYVHACLRGITYIYTLRNPERVTIEVYHRNGEWLIGQARTEGNGLPSSSSQKKIDAFCKEKGII